MWAIVTPCHCPASWYPTLKSSVSSIQWSRKFLRNDNVHWCLGAVLCLIFCHHFLPILTVILDSGDHDCAHRSESLLDTLCLCCWICFSAAVKQYMHDPSHVCCSWQPGIGEGWWWGMLWYINFSWLAIVLFLQATHLAMLKKPWSSGSSSCCPAAASPNPSPHSVKASDTLCLSLCCFLCKWPHYSQHWGNEGIPSMKTV